MSLATSAEQDLLDPAVPEARVAPGLAALGFADPALALANLRRLADTPRHRDLLAPLLPRLLRLLASSPDPDMALNNLERYAEAVMDRAVLFTTLATHPEAALVLVTVAATSQFLADTLCRHPQTLPWLLEPRVMRVRTREEMAEEIARALAPFATAEARANALRRVKKRELLRIGLRDILGDADLATTVKELSNLADAVLAEAWGLVRAELEAVHGRPHHEGGGPRLPTAFSIIALGKLGGEELNYSSDIDLCFVYEAEGRTDGPAPLPNRLFFARAAERLLDLLTRMTEEGYVYRVDLRLRPEGAKGALALPLEAYRAYHETRAALWERQALIKARPAAGDEALGRAFCALAEAFVYRGDRERAVVSEIQAVKARIDRLLQAQGRQERHVKLGVGGIREIEFHVQAFQLLYGGRDPWLRERSTLRALHRLAERGYLGWEEWSRLASAYSFLRAVEHRLQIRDALQTHTLPRRPEELGKLARRLGYPGGLAEARARFVADHDRVRREVRAAFTEFFADPRPAIQETPPPWSPEALAAAGFADPERARQNLTLLWEGPPLAPAPRQLRRALGAFLPAVLEALRDLPDPDTALNQLERLIAAAGPRTAYLHRLAGDLALLRRLLLLLARAEALAQSLITRPELLDELADPESLTRRVRGAVLEAEFWRMEGQGLDPPDRLRLWKRAQELRIAWQDLVGGLPGERLGRALTELAESAIGLAWRLAEAEVQGRYGAPKGGDGSVGALVVGLGKLGGRELDYGSDLDLFVLYEAEGETAGPERVPHRVYFDRLVERLHGLLADITRTGQVFRVDLRLRPGGPRGSLAHSFEAFAQYAGEWAELWERQALIKARPVWGDPGLARRVGRFLHRHVFAPGLDEAGLAEIHRLRMRMETELGREGPGRLHVKFGAGGLLDIEFLVQALQLRHGAAHPALRTPSTRVALRRLARLGLLGAPVVEELLEAYDFAKRLIKGLRLAQHRPPDCL
ncbi:MAG: bifunctional [glutamate--ammonia ligase]-adenylyl-L-tyrosine phosphorylase/[glutamate--ammonia-ligase] adenylyltransferase, partial [Candidatus Rokubacteria bacterium]|nr:bifunctional [glutamate--ammonia ligase]-adenylyl-L-tyrosine phosphorylase/[glutamate--ammonia-ligase] adenylyltransferase [Candidatus Rokubacteria bacterium]